MASRTYNWRVSAMSVFLILLVLWLHVEEGEARPTWTMPTITFVKKFQHLTTRCAHDAEILELCQRCAKATKSNFAYPMCCGDEEGAIRWCRDYIYFGIQ